VSIFGVFFDRNADPGSKFDADVVAEIEFVAPSTVTNGSITTAKIKDLAVSFAKLAFGAVHSTNIGTGEVKAVNIGASEVTTSKLDNDAVTGAKAGLGTVTSVDNTDSYIECKIKYVTAAQYALIGAPDANVEYHISA
jgi:hypothetical protein